MTTHQLCVRGGTFLYRCPATGLNVQGLGADHPDALK